MRVTPHDDDHLRDRPPAAAYAPSDPDPNQPDPLPPTATTTYPAGVHFPWGPIDAVHSINGIDIVEYRTDLSRLHSPHDPAAFAEHGRTYYAAYVDGHHVGRSKTLDSALVAAIAYRREGPNSQAAAYFDAMTGATSRG